MKTEIKCPLCGDSMVRPKLSPGCLTHEHQTRCPFVWNDLTEEQMGVLRDAALGRAVRRLPVEAYLHRVAGGWRADDGGWQADAGVVPDIAEGDTPDAALEAAGLMEVEK